MTSALRKKIASNTGLPPSLLAMRAFWSELEKQCEVWALEQFNVDTPAKIVTKKVVSSPVADDVMTSDVSFAFSADASPGVVAIVLGRDVAHKYSAYRFNESAAAFADVSSVFLKLTSEQPACMLRKMIAEQVFNEDEGVEACPIEDYSQVAGGLVPRSRYLIVTLEFTLDSQPARIKLVLALEFVLDFSRLDVIRLISSKGADTYGYNNTLLQSVQQTEITIEAVIDHVSLSVGQWSRLQIGQTIDLPNADLNKLSIATETIEGPLDIANAQMGVWKKQRAIKLQSAVHKTFIHNLASQ